MTSYDGIKAKFLNALLADASYVDALPITGNQEDLKKYGKLAERLGTPFAEYLAANFKVIDQYTSSSGSGFSATVFKALDSDQVYLSFRGTEPPDPGDWLADLDLAMLNGAPALQVIEAINYMFRLTTSSTAPAPQVQFNDLGTLLQFLQAGSPATFMPWSQVLELGNTPGLASPALVDPTTQIIVDGHSLGGALATALTRLFSSQISANYTYNSAGFHSTSEYFFSAISELLELGTTTWQDTKQTNIFAINGTNVTTDDVFFQEHGTRVPIFNELSTDLSYKNHLIYKLTDSLALYEAFGNLDHNLTETDITNLISASSEVPNASLESTLDALRRIFLGTADPTRVDDTDGNLPARVNYQQHLIDLKQTIAYQAHINSLTISSLVGLDPESLAQLASGVIPADQLGYLYALQNLAPFVILGDSALPGYANLDPTEFSDEYVRDRASMLAALLNRNLDDKPAGSSTFGEPGHFVDRASGTVFTVVPAADVAALASTDFLFGTAYDDSGAANALVGSDHEDHIFGGAGSDQIVGGGGYDLLDGGAGNDILYGGAKDAINVDDLRRDTLQGGSGSDVYYVGNDDVVIDEDPDSSWVSILNDGAAVSLSRTYVQIGTGSSIYRSTDGLLTLYRHGEDVDIIGNGLPGAPTVHILGAAPGGNFGSAYNVTLAAPDPLATNLHRIDGTSYDDCLYYSPLNTYYSPITGTRNPKAIQGLYGTNGADLIQGFAGNDAIYGLGSDDQLVTQRDTLLGGDGNDYIFSGADYDLNNRVANYGNRRAWQKLGGDYIDGGPGNDWCIGVRGDDTIIGGAGNDFLGGDYGKDILDGGEGDDHIAGGRDGDLIIGGSGQDIIFGGKELEIWGASVWVPQIVGRRVMDISFPQLRVSSAASNTQTASTVTIGERNPIPDNDRIFAGTGDDIVFGNAGDDLILGEDGSDVLFGDVGSDTLDGGEGNDFLYGEHFGYYNEAGLNDKVDDELHGGGGNDELYGDDGSDRLFGDDGTDILDGGVGSDTLYGGDGTDTLRGGDGQDYLDGGSEDDLLKGGGEADYLAVVADRKLSHL